MHSLVRSFVNLAVSPTNYKDNLDIENNVSCHYNHTILCNCHIIV